MKIIHGYCAIRKGHKRRKSEDFLHNYYDDTMPTFNFFIVHLKDIVGVEGKTDMSEDYEKFHEIPPFNVKADPSILINNEDYPWLRRNKQMTQAKKK